MENSNYIEKILPSFERYYTVNKENPEEPFFASAEFSSHGEQYFLVKSAKLAEIDSKEFVYFYESKMLSFEDIKNLSQKAWNLSQSKIKPYYGHKNSDVSLIIACSSLDEKAKKNIKKIKFSKSYKWGFFGWSNFKLAIKELSSNKVYFNRLGSDWKKLLLKIN